MTKYEIEKDIPMPKSPSKYPFADMEVGESVLAPDKHEAGLLQSAAWYFGKKASRKFAMRGLRIWRIE